MAEDTTVGTEAHAALAQLSDDALRRLILELGRYALSVSSKLYWRTGDAAELPRGETVDSIVSTAFTKMLSGERRWQPQREPDIKTYLMNVIDSLLYHLATSKDNTMVTAMPETQSAGEIPLQSRADASAMAWQAQPPGSPEAILVHQEDEQHKERMLQHLRDACRDDPLLAQVVQAMQEGYGKPADIAEVVGHPVADIYNALKRLDRKIVRLRHQERG